MFQLNNLGLPDSGCLPIGFYLFALVRELAVLLVNKLRYKKISYWTALMSVKRHWHKEQCSTYLDGQRLL